MKYPILNNSTSLLAKNLSVEIFETLKDKQTTNGVSLENIIFSGVKNPDSGVGVYAGDVESYETFAPLLNPIIKDYHKVDLVSLHVSDLHVKILECEPLDDKYIISTRIRVGRNLKDFPLGPCISQQQRKEVETLVVKALMELEGELKGTYYSLETLNNEEKTELIKDHFLFKEGDRFLEAAGLNRNWPNGRGIYHNKAKTFLVWVNEEDELRIISMEKGGDIQSVFGRLQSAVKELEKSLNFAFDKKLGYITSCPSNLGTAMRASVHVKLPLLSQNKELFEEICEKYQLQIRGIHGEHSQSEGGVYDISNKRRLGISEVECVELMAKGVKVLIDKEKELE